MNPNVIQFACSHCQSVLTVPAHLAGVAGPCPKCGQHIVSPAASTSSAPAPVFPAMPPAEPPPMAQPAPGQWAPAPERPMTRPMTVPLNPQTPIHPMAGMMPPMGMPPAEPAMGWGAPPQMMPPQVMPSLTGMPGMPPPYAPPNDPAAAWGQPPQQVAMSPMHDAGVRSPVMPMSPGMGMGMPPMTPQTGITGRLPGTLPQHLMSPPVAQGPALAPPMQPTNPVAEAMQNMTRDYSREQEDPANMGMTSALSRPMTIGGSRLSLLARQLSTGQDGSPNLPQAPAALSNDDLPGAQAPQPTAMPDNARNRNAANLLLQQQTRRGMGLGKAPSRAARFVKVALVALLLLAALGAGIWKMRGPLGLSDLDLKGLFTRHTTVQEVAEPQVVTHSVKEPIPGVDDIPTPAPKKVEHVVIAPKPLAPAPVPEPNVTLQPTETPLEQPTSVAGGKMSGDPALTQEDSGTPKAVKMVPLPQPPRATPVDTEPPAPRAVPVEQTPNGMAIARTSPAQAETPQSAATASLSREPMSTPAPAVGNEDRAGGLVEIGRSKDDPKVLPGSARVAISESVERPVIKNVPPKCMPALDGLKKFLAAGSLNERLPFMQMGSQLKRTAQIYYTSNPDGAVEVDEIHYLRHDEDPEVGKGMHVVFVLFSRAWEYGIPVMVEHTANGTLVDWLTFVEFKDNLLHKFLTNYMDGPVRFHVGIRRTHYFEDNVPNLDEKDTFEVTTPMENVHGFAFVPKGTPLQRSLAGTISWDKEMSWVIVELQWRREGTSRWIEMTALPQLNWYSAASAGDSPDSVAAPASQLGIPQAPKPADAK